MSELMQHEYDLDLKVWVMGSKVSPIHMGMIKVKS